jgi:hypothetical protein
MSRVFISHKQEDLPAAAYFAARLKAHNVASYLDVLDPQLAKSGDDLGEYFRQAIGACTHLVAVLSPLTQSSWWVPFEIGIATEKSYPLASYARLAATVPDYLKKWPYLRTDNDIDAFALQISQSETSTQVRNIAEAAMSDRRRYARDFHSALKRKLRQ